MSDLRNSQRISYKATYNQVSPTATISDTGEQNGDRNQGRIRQGPFRAVEKVAFVQALRIVPEELSRIKQQLAKRADEVASEDHANAIAAIEQLVNDRRPASTLLNASQFSEISSTVLIDLAESLMDHRQTVSASIDESLAKILSAHRQVRMATSATPVSDARAAPRQAPTSETPARTHAVHVHGIPILTTIKSAQARKVQEDQSNRVSEGYSIDTSIDETKSPPPQLAPTTGASASLPSSNAAAIAWAQENQPKLFAQLSGDLAPYTWLSKQERLAVGDAHSLVNLMQTTYAAVFNPDKLRGSIAGFQARMEIEPVGNLHLERIEMYPSGVERGELAHSVPLAPGETVNISHKEWSVSEKEFEEIVHDYFEGYSEEGVAEKTDIAMSNDSQSQHSTALNLGASLSASYASVTLSTSFGYNTASNDSQSRKDSRNHSMAITKKASARTKKDHKVTFKVTSVAGSEDQSVRVISNPSATDSMRIDYFQLARKWKMDLLRYGLRMTYDIVIPNPGSGIVKLVQDVKSLEAMINTPFTFTLPLTAITYNSLATDPDAISNYDQLAAQFNANVTAPPEARKYVNVHKEPPSGNYDEVRFDSVEFDIDPNYYIYQFHLETNFERNSGDTRSYLKMLDGASIENGITALIGTSGHLSLSFEFQYIYYFAINITFSCRPKVQMLLDWRLQAWNQIRQAAEDDYAKSVQSYKDQQSKLLQEIADFDALTLRRMEQEEIMKGVLRWLLGPEFYLVPFNIASLFGQDSNDPDATDVLDPNRLSDAEWMNVMEYGEFIKYLHNAIEWENVLYFTYPYFWDDNKLWDFKKFLYHPDATHRMFLRSGAARVVLTIRPGFEASFTSLIESGSFGGLPGSHPYVTIAQEIQDYAKTNYPGFPPANPEQNARPLLYLEQRRVWKEMQYIIQLLNAYKDDKGTFPAASAGNKVPAAVLDPYRNNPLTINGVNYNGINDYNTKSNNQQLLLDSATPQEALLPTYANVPVSDIEWGNDYFYKCPGDTGDYDLISYGADGAPGGTGKDTDISANAEASLISTWYEYTPINGLDIGITMNKPNVVPPQPSTEIA
jgi:hypothetical protein